MSQSKPSVTSAAKYQMEGKIPDSPSVSAFIPASPSITPLQDDAAPEKSSSPPASISGKALYSQRVILTSKYAYLAAVIELGSRLFIYG